MADDPFPRDRLGEMVHRMPAYLRLSWRLAREPLLSKARRMAVIGAAGYLVSPVDLVPGVIPIVGQLDDIAVALAALRLALAGLSPEQRHAHLSAVGLADEHLVADLRTVGATTAWLARAGYRTTKAVAVRGAGIAQTGAGVAARTSRSVADRATPAAKVAGAKAVDTGAKAVDAGTKAARAAGAAFGRMPGFRRAGREPEILVVKVEPPLLPPPPPGRARDRSG